MKNFKVTSVENGKEYWISRAHAVVGIVYTIHNGSIFFLVSKRGCGCPDNVGYWACTCGYLDWGETRKDAVRRELYEELGLDLSVYPKEYIEHFCTVDDPNRDARENIVSRYLIKVDYESTNDKLSKGEINNNTESRGGEKDEVEEIRFIDSDFIDYFEWAFNHGEILKEVVKYIKTGQKPNYCDE